MKSIEFNALIKAAKNKDSRAMAILTEYCVKVIKSRITYKFGCLNEAEDLARDVFTYKILSNLPDYYVDSHIAWLYKVTDNYVISHLEKEKPVEEYDDGFYADEKFRDLVDEILVKDALHKLDKTTAEILALTFYCGLNSIEVGAKLNMTPEAVRQRIVRGKKICKKYVTDKE